MADPPVTLPPVPEGWTLAIFCGYCHGALALQRDDLPTTEELQNWTCPYCAKQNGGKFPYTIKWVTKGHGPDRSV